MRLTSWLLFVLLLTGGARAESPRSPLRLIPEQADIVLQIHQPRRLVESITTLEAVKQAQQLEAVKELLDSTRTRRFFQFVAFFEKQLGATSNELLDRLAGGGIVVSGKIGDKAPFLLAVQGTDEALMRKFLKTGLDVFEQELARQDLPVKFIKEDYQGVSTYRLGNDLHYATVEGALLVTNQAEMLHKSLDLAAGREKKCLAGHPGLSSAAKLLPKDPLASFWLNMEPVKKQPGFEGVYKTPRDPFITVLFGGWADLLGRTPFLCGAFARDDKGFLATFRVPKGSKDMGADKAVNCPAEGQAGSRPLLQPKGMLFSNSYYWDIAQFWNERVALFGAERAKDIEEFDKNSSRPLSTLSFSKQITALGPYQRLVAANQVKAGYKKQPKNLSPAFAAVLELRKPEEFSKGMETALRVAGLTSSVQFGLKLSEETYKGHEIIGYRFDETKPLKGDVNDDRFNFSPCFVRAGNQYVVSSTIELCRELIDLLDQEAKGQDKGSPLTSRAVFAPAGGKELLKSFREQLIAAAVLGQALPLGEAKAQVETFFQLLDLLDGVTMEEQYGDKQFHLDFRVNFKK